MSEITFPIYIDSSMRKDLAACKQKFNLKYVKGLATVRENEHLIAGRAFAKGMEIMRMAFYREGKPEEIALQEGISAVLSTFGDFSPPKGSAKSADRIASALVSYKDHYGLAGDPLKPLIVNRVPFVEFNFAVPIPGTKHPQTGEQIIYVGKLDMLGELEGMLWVVDEKTTTSLGPSWIEQWETQTQPLGYFWALQQYGYNPIGYIIRGVSILKHSHGHAQVQHQVAPYMVERWLVQLKHDIAGAIQCWNNNYWDFAFDTACSSFGGCPFRSVCTARDPTAFPGEFEIREPWNPLTKED